MARGTRELLLNAVAFVILLGIGLGYLAFGVLDVHPWRSETTVSLVVPDSSQILTGTTVSIYGVPVGAVRSVEPTADGAVVRLAFDDRYRVPRDVPVVVTAQSALGEPVVDLRPPENAGGAMLRSGDRIGSAQVTVPEAVPEFFSVINSLVGILPADSTAGLLKTFGEAMDGSDGSLTMMSVGGQLLEKTLSSRRRQLRTMFAATQRPRDLDTMIDKLAELSGSFGPLTVEFRGALQASQHFVQGSHLPAAAKTHFTPFFLTLAGYLDKILPAGNEIIGPIAPMLDQATGDLPTINLSKLLGSQLSMLDAGPRDGAVRVSVGPKGMK
ncbi:MAG: MlaD family protein [Gordonia amarae]